MEQPIGTALHILSGDLWGGAEAQMLHQLTALGERGWTVQVLLFNELETAKRYRSAKLNCTVIEEKQGLLKLLHQARTTFSCLSPDIVAAHGYKESVAAWWITRGTATPWISTFHGLTEQPSGIAAVRMTVYRAVLMMLVRRSAAAAVAVSRALADALRLPDSVRVEIVPNVYAFGGAGGKRRTEALFAHLPAITVVGRLVPVKRVDRAIEGFSRLLETSDHPAVREAHLYIIGDGPQRAKLEELVDSLDLASRIHFLGFRENADAYIAGSSLLLLTSDSEGIPTVLLEAAAHGTPVVCTAAGGIPEVLERLEGYPAELAEMNAPSVAAALQRALTKEGMREQAASCRSRFEEHFSPSVAAKRLEALYFELLEREKADS